MYCHVAVLLALVAATPAQAAPRRFLPHETNCTQYYITNRKGQRFPMICPPGKQFDYGRQQCKDAAEANCTTLSSITATTVPTTEDTTAPEDTAPTTTKDLPEYIHYLPNRCPVDPRFQLLLPHDKYCAVFYECRYGIKIMKICSPGERFSYELQDCLTAAEVDCPYSDRTTLDSVTAYADSVQTTGSAPTTDSAQTADGAQTTDSAQTAGSAQTTNDAQTTTASKQANTASVEWLDTKSSTEIYYEYYD